LIAYYEGSLLGYKKEEIKQLGHSFCMRILGKIIFSVKIFRDDEQPILNSNLRGIETILIIKL
jgi:hypothetical protein